MNDGDKTSWCCFALINHDYDVHADFPSNLHKPLGRVDEGRKNQCQ